MLAVPVYIISATGQHFYSDDMMIIGILQEVVGHNGIRFRDTHAATIRGGLYADTSNNLGFLDSAGYWAYRTSAQWESGVED